MHMKGKPRSMQESPLYDDVLGEVFEFLLNRRDLALDAGVDSGSIILDPGIGFGKRLQDNVALLSRLGEFRSLGHPLMVGASRKSFIGELSGAPVKDRGPGTLAAISTAVSQGVDIVRVHDVSQAAQALAVADALHRSKSR
jgi:dihydropteroate synthase